MIFIYKKFASQTQGPETKASTYCAVLMNIQLSSVFAAWIIEKWGQLFFSVVVLIVE